jgi:hypothetical protein
VEEERTMFTKWEFVARRVWKDEGGGGLEVVYDGAGYDVVTVGVLERMEGARVEAVSSQAWSTSS